MKTRLFFLFLLLTPPALAQVDSTYWPPPSQSAVHLRDSLTAERRVAVSQATENTLLRSQNERLMNKEARFWGIAVLLVIAELAKMAIGR